MFRAIITCGGDCPIKLMFETLVLWGLANLAEPNATVKRTIKSNEVGGAALELTRRVDSLMVR